MSSLHGVLQFFLVLGTASGGTMSDVRIMLARYMMVVVSQQMRSRCPASPDHKI